MESHISGATRGRGHRYEQRYGPAARTSQHDRGGAVGASRAERPDPIVAFAEDSGYGRVCREGSVCGHDRAAIKPRLVSLQLRQRTWSGRRRSAVTPPTYPSEQRLTVGYCRGAVAVATSGCALIGGLAEGALTGVRWM